MSKSERNHDDHILSNLHTFLEADFEETKKDHLEELKNAGIDPESEVSWVNQFVANKVREISRANIELASAKRRSVLARLAELTEANRDRLEQMVDELRGKLEGAGADLAEFQTAYNKLEDPTEEDLRSILKDWVELAEWEGSAGTDDGSE